MKPKKKSRVGRIGYVKPTPFSFLRKDVFSLRVRKWCHRTGSKHLFTKGQRGHLRRKPLTIPYETGVLGYR